MSADPTLALRADYKKTHPTLISSTWYLFTAAVGWIAKEDSQQSARWKVYTRTAALRPPDATAHGKPSACDRVRVRELIARTLPRTLNCYFSLGFFIFYFFLFYVASSGIFKITP